MNTDKLSPTMRAAMDAAQTKGSGKLTRYPGGFWYADPASQIWFNTSTVQALVTRGHADYTQWKARDNGSRFPIEATIIQDVKQ